MKQLKKHVPLLAMIAMLQCGFAQQGGNDFSLQQSIEYALKHSPNHMNSMLDEQNAEYKRREVRGLGLPQVNGSIDVKDYLALPTSLIPGDFVGRPGTYLPVKFGTKYNATAGFSASQLLFSSDYIFALKASKEFLNLSKISVSRSKSELAAQVSKAYYTVLINRDRMTLLEANITRLQKAFDDTRAFNQQGFVEAIDVERLEVSLNNLVTVKENTSRLIGLSETLLKFQMGYKLEDPINLTDSLSTDNNFQEFGSGKIDVTQRPDYQLLQSQQTLLDIDVKRMKWGYLPTLAAYGSYQYNSQRNQFDFFNSDKNNPTKQWYKIGLIGATLNINIFDGFQRHNRIQQASISAQKNVNNIRNVELGGELEATVASITFNNALASVKNQKRNMELAQHVYDVAQKKYEAGVGSNLEVVTAETALVEAQTNYFNALYDMIVAKTDYQKATGTLIK